MSGGYWNSPSALLAVAFPPQQGLRGACVTLVDLMIFRPRLMSKREAARLVFARNMERHAPGKGNRARRRIRSLRALSVHDLPLAQPRLE